MMLAVTAGCEKHAVRVNYVIPINHKNDECVKYIELVDCVPNTKPPECRASKITWAWGCEIMNVAERKQRP